MILQSLKSLRPAVHLCNRLVRSTDAIAGITQSQLAAPYIRPYSSSSPPNAGVKFSLTRGDYSTLREKDISHFLSILSEAGVQYCGAGGGADEDEMEKYNVDWLRTARGSSKLVLKPNSVEQVSQIMKYCYEHRLAVVPQGGNTGLVAGGIAAFDEIIMSLERMNKLTKIDTISGVLTCEAGCILSDLDDKLAPHRLMVPLDLASKGSCQIGGNVSTNAGGLRLLRYGSMHANVLGLQAVLADGTILDTLCPLRKDNTGYDLKQLFIGSEGTLGVVTAVSLLCPQPSTSVNVTLVGCESFAKVLDILKVAKQMLSETLSAFEYMDQEAMLCCTSNLGLTNPIQESPFYVLAEVSGSNEAHNTDKLALFLEHLNAENLIRDGTIASDLTRIKSLWKIRESMAESLMRDGYTFKYDVSLPLSHFYEIVPIMRRRLRGKVTRVASYGHVGDGNLHFNVTTPQHSLEVEGLIEPYLYEYVQQHGGSISAEHGIGLTKAKYLCYSKSAASIELMRRLKRCLDPRSILNPYKLLRPLTPQS